MRGEPYSSQLSHSPHYGHHLECDLGNGENRQPLRVVVVWICTIILSIRAKRTPVKKVDEVCDDLATASESSPY